MSESNVVKLGAMVDADRLDASLPTRAASASSQSPVDRPFRLEDRDQHLKALRPPRVPWQDRWRIPDALALGSFAVAHPRLANGDRANAGHDLAFRKMAVAHDAVKAGLGLQIGMLCQKLGDLRLNGLGQQRTRAAAQDLCGESVKTPGWARLPVAIVMLPALPELSVSAVIPVGTVDDVRSISSAPATVTVISPPLPAPNVSVVIWPLGPIESEPAAIVMSPAFPVMPEFRGTGSAVMPVTGPVADVPSIVRPPVTLTSTLPALPAPRVSAVLCPSGPIDRVPAVAITLPPFPDPCVSLGNAAESRQLNRTRSDVDIAGIAKPESVTRYFAAVDDRHIPRGDVQAAALPWLPRSASVVIPVRKWRLAFAPLMVSAPAALTDRLPALPVPKVPLEI